MKKFLLKLTICATMAFGILAGASAQPGKVDGQVDGKSFGIDYKPGSLGLTYLNDGVDGLAGIQFTAINGFAGSDRLSLQLVAVSDWKASNRQYYVGTTIGYRFYGNPDGLHATLYAGLKGFSFSDGFSDFSLADKNPFIFGIGVVFPLK